MSTMKIKLLSNCSDNKIKVIKYLGVTLTK